VGDPHYYYSYQAAKLRARGMIKKLISTWWETIPLNNESTAAKKRIKKYTMHYVDRFVCYAEKAKQCLIAEGINENIISHIPLGVDTSIFYPAQIKKNKDFMILFVGRLVEEKGILDVYEAFKQIVSNGEGVALKIVGMGPLENTLQSLIQKDNLQDRVIIENKSYQEMPEVFRQADLLCVPSKRTSTWEEQYGMVFIEAMASGLPIVSYSTGSIPEVVGNAGLFAKENNINELVTLIIRIIKTRDLGVKLGTMGRERVERMFDAQKIAATIDKLYKQL